jgi:alpha-tubulin suppressor-like RCC1 family protein
MQRALCLAALAALSLAGCGGGIAPGSAQAGRQAQSGFSQDQAQAPADSTRLGAGMGYTAGLSTDGHVYAWGDNTYGQLGATVPGASAVPLPVTGISNVRALAAGGYHVAALIQDGTVWAWGNNSYGQLGQGEFSAKGARPLPVPGLSGIRALSSGYLFSLATHVDGSVWWWGHVNNANHATLQQVQGISSVTQAAAGFEHALAVREDGTVWGWGSNKAGQVGSGDKAAMENTPVQVQGLDQAVQVSAGYVHSLALRADGTVWAWGTNSFGQLGVGVASTRVPLQVKGLPVPANGSAGIKAIVAGIYDSIVVYADGSVWAWGANSYGQLGNGTLARADAPSPMQLKGRAVGAASGNGHVVVLMDDGSAYAIGNNGTGQLGNNTRRNALQPVQVMGPGGKGLLNLGASQQP